MRYAAVLLWRNTVCGRTRFYRLSQHGLEMMYGEWGATRANIAVGLVSALVDNIPVMFAVLSMELDMSQVNLISGEVLH